MGITKRNFSFSSLRLKTSSSAIDTGTDYDIDTSPPYSPTPSEMERPSVHPQLIFDLRQACAIIVNETNPPDPDEEPTHIETLRKFEEERKAKFVAQARVAEIKSLKAEMKSTRAEQRASEKAQKEHARQVEADTRRAIAQEAEPERRKVIERQAELRMGKSADSTKDQARKEQPRRYSTRRPPEDVPVMVPRSEPRPAVPKNVAASTDGPMSPGRPVETYIPSMEPFEPTHTKHSSKAKGKQRETDIGRHQKPSETRSVTRLELLPPVHATIVTNSQVKDLNDQEPVLDHIRASMHDRPKTSAAATVDYHDRSGESSKSTTRSNTEYDNQVRPTSTAVTSAVLTPGEDKRISYNRSLSDDSYRKSPSDESYPNEVTDPHARAWQDHKAVLRQAEEKYNKSGRAARPGSKASKRSRRWGGGDGDSDLDRPLSRAGSITESIRSGISHYIRPRASQDSMRSGRSSATGLSRSHSRSSSMSRRSSSGWWRGAGLRRKGSWSSFRSTRLDQEEPSKLRKNGEPNLNRPLPALPGLDQYKETKTHIGQLMKAGTRGRKKEKTPRPDAPYPLQQQQPNGHIKKESISNPMLRNESMERTLHRYRESQIIQEPQRKPSSSQLRQGSPRRMLSPEIVRKDSENSIPRSTSRQGQDVPRSQSRQGQDVPRSQSRQGQDIPRSQSRQEIPRSQSRTENPLKPTKNRRDSESTAHKQPPPMIRGPSWQKEIEAAVYPRPMEVNKGPVEVRYENGMYIHDVQAPSPTLSEGLSPTKRRHGEGGEWERKGGLKGRVGRIFGGRDARIVDSGARRTVQRSITAS